jgi:hypothetical protein
MAKTGKDPSGASRPMELWAWGWKLCGPVASETAQGRMDTLGTRFQARVRSSQAILRGKGSKANTRSAAEANTKE